MKCVACGYEAEIEENFNSWGFKKLNIEISINGHDNNCKTTIDGKVETKLKELLYKIAYDYDFIIEEMEVMPDHVHILISCNPRYGIMQCVQNIKSITAKELFKEFPFIKKRYLWGGKFWSRSSFVSTVGSVSLETVKQYIENQKTN